MSNHVCIIKTIVGFQNQWSKDGEELEDTRYIVVENNKLHILSRNKEISFCIKQNYLIFIIFLRKSKLLDYEQQRLSDLPISSQ